MEESTAYRLGYDCVIECFSDHSNPYSLGTDNFTEWERGYDAGEVAAQKEFIHRTANR